MRLLYGVIIFPLGSCGKAKVGYDWQDTRGAAGHGNHKVQSFTCMDQFFTEKLRRIRYYDIQNNQSIIFLTNNFTLPTLTIAKLYKCRWQVELFFKWIKQHLRIKSFFGTSGNAVKTQIWIAISIYVLIAIIKKRLNLQNSLYTILQILSITILEKTPIMQILTETDYKEPIDEQCKQLLLFNL